MGLEPIQVPPTPCSRVAGSLQSVHKSVHIVYTRASGVPCMRCSTWRTPQYFFVSFLSRIVVTC